MGKRRGRRDERRRAGAPCFEEGDRRALPQYSNAERQPLLAAEPLILAGTAQKWSSRLFEKTSFTNSSLTKATEAAIMKGRFSGIKAGF
jgi:hypothetical protein